MEITLTIDRAAVLAEVAQRTEYTGAKSLQEDGAYDRIRTVDEDAPELLKFWDESRADMMLALKHLYPVEEQSGETYSVKIHPSSMFDTAQLPSMTDGLFSYFVDAIISKWYVYTNKDDAGAYATGAASMLEGVRQKAVHPKRVERPEGIVS